MILQGLKPRIFNKLNKFNRRWLAEPPSVIWSLRTTPSRATGFSPFFLVYGSEAILPIYLEYGSPRLKAYQERQNQQAREDSLDQVDEARDVALLHSARLLAPTNVTSDDAHRRQFGVAVFHEPRINPQAQQNEQYITAHIT